jgi:TonB family protein
MTPHAPNGAGATGRRDRRRGPGSDAITVGVVATLLAHAAVLIGVDVGVERPLVAALVPPVAAAGPLDPSCDGEAIMRAAARAMVCVSPAVDDAGACLDDVELKLRNDFILCHIDELEMLPPVQIVDARQVRRLEEISPIDAEPLLEPLTPEEMQRFEEKKLEVAAAPPPPPPPPPAQPPVQAQVIETVKPQNEEAPDEARFLAEFDSKADEQKVARGSKHEEIAKAPDPEELKATKNPRPANQPEPAEEQIGKSEDAPKTPGALSMRNPGHPSPSEVPQEKRVAGDTRGSDAPTGDGTTAKRGDGSISQEERKPVETAQGDGGGGGGSARAPNLRPDDETLERLVGGGSVDHVDDVVEGDENQFNARRWVYATFFNRMKRQVAQNWDPASVWKSEDPDGKRHGFKTRVTQLKVSLDGKGGVKKILIVSPSGVDALDEEAIRSFKAAQPFPNPPSALVDRDGLITFEFGFYFEINNEKRTAWKFNRSL